MRRIAILIAVLSVAGQLSAQNINQSVQVTNEYETKFADFQKQGVAMSVPDSLYSFDYNFDYSVFETPYKGSYEFSPYRIKITPDPLPYDGRKFYMRAGAGYSMHPELDIVFTPVAGNSSAFSLYNTGRGYVGKEFYDLKDELGLGGYVIMKNSTFDYAAAYEGIFAGAGEQSALYNSAYAALRLRSARKSSGYIHYDMGVKYRYGMDAAVPGAGEHLVSVAGSAGPVLDGGRFGFMLDFDLQMSSLVSSLVSLTPRLDFELGPFDIDAGARLDYVSASGNKFGIAPHLSASVDVLKETMKIELGLSGGRSLLSHYSLKNLNHFYIRSGATPTDSWEKLNAYAAFKGHIGSFFQYELKGGYSVNSSMPLANLTGIGFVDYNSAYAGVAVQWVSERVDFDAQLKYAHNVFASAPKLFAPSALTADLDFCYNWIDRVYAGLALEYASERKDLSSTVEDIPAYADLGLYGEYRFNRKWSAWAKAGNLLGMSIQRVPGYVEKGVYFTLGVSLSL